MTENLEKLYQRAIENPGFRQAFLRKLDLGENKQYVSYVHYRQTTIRKEIFKMFGINKETIMSAQSLPSIKNFLKSGGDKSSIIVYPSAFLWEINFQDFLNTLIHHEGFHARQKFEGHYVDNYKSVKDFARSYLVDMEVEAYQNQLKHLTPQNSETYIQCIKEELSEFLKKQNKR